LVSSSDFHPASIRRHHFARTSFIVKQFQLFLLKSSIIFPIRLFQSSVEGLRVMPSIFAAMAWLMVSNASR